MSGFVKFSLGALSGLVLSGAIAVPVVHYSERGGVDAVQDDLQYVGAAVSEMLKYEPEDPEALERAKALAAEVEAEIAMERSTFNHLGAMRSLDDFMSNLNGSGLVALEPAAGETPEQAMERVIKQYEPMLRMIAEKAPPGSKLAKAIMDPIDRACDPTTRGDAATRNRILGEQECENIRKLMNGEIDFDAIVQGRNLGDVDAFSDTLNRRLIQSVGADQQTIITKEIQATLLGQNGDARGNAVAAPGDGATLSPIPAARPRAATASQDVAATTAKIEPGPNWDRLPERVRAMGAEKLYKKCQEEPPAAMSEIMKQLTRQICADAFQ